MAAQYPGAAGTDANLFVAVNNLSSSLSDNPLTIGATTVNVASTTGFPTTGYITIEAEAISYTGVTGTSFTGCTRGADGTAAASHVTALSVFHNVVAAHRNVLKDEIKAIETDLVASYTGGSTTIATTFAKYLKLIGGTMSGAIAMGTSKITGLGNGTAAQDAAAFIQLKVIQVAPLISSTTNFSTTSSTYQTTNLSGSITPTSASNRILIVACGMLTNNSNSDNVFASLFNGASNLLAASGQGNLFSNGTGITEVEGSCTLMTIDSPASTSAQTYSVKIKNTSNTATMQFGRVGTQTMLLVEVV